MKPLAQNGRPLVDVVLEFRELAKNSFLCDFELKVWFLAGLDHWWYSRMPKTYLLTSSLTECMYYALQLSRSRTSPPPFVAPSSPPSVGKSMPPSAAFPSPPSTALSSPPFAGNAMPPSAAPSSLPPSVALSSLPSAGNSTPPSAAHSSPEHAPVPAPQKRYSEPAPPEQPPVPAPRQRPPEPAPQLRPQVSTPPERPKVPAPSVHQTDRAPTFPKEFFWGGSRAPAIEAEVGAGAGAAGAGAAAFGGGPTMAS